MNKIDSGDIMLIRVVQKMGADQAIFLVLLWIDSDGMRQDGCLNGHFAGAAEKQIIPFSAGALLGWWRKTPSQPMNGLPSSCVSGFVTMEIDVFILFAEGLITEIAAQRHIELGEALGEFVEWVLFLGFAGLILGLLGGSASGLLAFVTRRGRGQNAPQGPDGSSPSLE